MANEYYNLAGWLRDVRAVLNDARSNDRAATFLQHLVDLWHELVPLEAYGGDDESVPDELESEDADDDLVSTGPRDRSDAGEERMRPRTRREAPLGGSARMADVLPRDLRGKKGSAPGDAPALAGAGPAVRGIIRTDTVTVPLPLNRPDVPRGTSKGGVRKRKLTPATKRGKSQTSSRGRGKVRR